MFVVRVIFFLPPTVMGGTGQRSNGLEIEKDWSWWQQQGQTCGVWNWLCPVYFALASIACQSCLRAVFGLFVLHLVQLWPAIPVLYTWMLITIIMERSVGKLKPQNLSTLVCQQLVEHLPGSSPESFDGRMWEVEGWGFCGQCRVRKTIPWKKQYKTTCPQRYVAFLPPKTSWRIGSQMKSGCH